MPKWVLRSFLPLVGCISIPFVPRLNERLGTGRSTKIGIVLLALAFNLPFTSSSYALLCSSLLLVGLLSGFTDVSMNALVSIVKAEGAFDVGFAHGF